MRMIALAAAIIFGAQTSVAANERGVSAGLTCNTFEEIQSVYAVSTSTNLELLAAINEVNKTSGLPVCDMLKVQYTSSEPVGKLPDGGEVKKLSADGFYFEGELLPLSPEMELFQYAVDRTL